MRIEASKCRLCEKVIVPPRKVCPYCGVKAGEMAPVSLDGHGSVLSYTILQMPPNGFEHPLLMALVELEHGAVVLCLGREIDMKDIAIGSSVEVERLSDGRLSFALLT
ncbi:MAG: Zn-ribbon domain-containing OB-fold protein [Candidatus Thorarchaeota archaeon]